MDDKDKRIDELEKYINVLETNLDYFANLAQVRQKENCELKDRLDAIKAVLGEGVI